MTALAKVTSKGQITLPKQIRDLLQIDTGSMVVFEADGDKLVFKTAKTLQDFRGRLKGRARNADFEEMREAAKEHIAKRGPRQ
jgi:antitoxin PrlF